MLSALGFSKYGVASQAMHDREPKNADSSARMRQASPKPGAAYGRILARNDNPKKALA
jgi:hypothetical protein